jgi:general secretion pathway protein K
MSRPAGAHEEGHRDPRSGLILVAVLWTIAFLSALAIATSVTFRGFAGVVAVDRDRVAAEGLLGAGLEFAAVFATRLGDRPLAATQTDIALLTGSVHVRLSDEAGRIDVNKAPVEILAALLQWAGAGGDAVAIAQSIEAWRARDRADQAGAARAQTPVPAPANVAPAPAGGQSNPAEAARSFQSFTDIRQLAQIAGMTRDYLAAIEPLTTVFGSDKVNVLTAPPDVIGLLPGVAPGQVETLLAARGEPGGENQLRAILGDANKYVTLQGSPVIRVEMYARLPDGYATAAKAVIIVLSGDNQPYRVLAWTPISKPFDPDADATSRF